jgi:hypothetical protein
LAVSSFNEGKGKKIIEQFYDFLRKRDDLDFFYMGIQNNYATTNINFQQKTFKNNICEQKTSDEAASQHSMQKGCNETVSQQLQVWFK